VWYVVIFRIPLQASKIMTAKLDGPMTCGYGIDAIDTAREIKVAAQTSAAHAERVHWSVESDDFETPLGALPEGYSEGVYEGRRYRSDEIFHCSQAIHLLSLSERPTVRLTCYWDDRSTSSSRAI
jgi:hypothetical protein